MQTITTILFALLVIVGYNSTVNVPYGNVGINIDTGARYEYGFNLRVPFTSVTFFADGSRTFIDCSNEQGKCVMYKLTANDAESLYDVLEPK